MDVLGAQSRHLQRIGEIRRIADEANQLSCGPDAAWYDELDAAENETGRLPTTSVAIVGPTGVGKSTLLNAVLGRRLLPVSSSHICTAAVTEIRVSADDRYHIAIDFVPDNTWTTDRDSIVEDLTQAYLTDGEIGEDLAELEARLRAVYGDALDHVTKSGSTLRSRLKTPPLIQEALDDKRRIFVTRDLDLARRALADHLDARRPFWPIVRRVEIAVPDTSLERHLCLVDLPGVNDANAAREATTRTALEAATSVVVVFHTRRGLTRDVQLLCEHPDLRNRVLDGRDDELAFVGTGLDDIDLIEDSDRFGLPTDDPVAVAKARAEDVRSNVDRQMADLALRLTRRRPASTQQARDALSRSSVVLVSSTDHLALLQNDHPRVFPDVSMTGIDEIETHLADTVDTSARRWDQSLDQRMDALIAEIYERLQRRRAEVAVVDDDHLDDRTAAAVEVQRIVDDVTADLRSVLDASGSALAGAITTSTDAIAESVNDQSPMVAELSRYWNELPRQALRTSVRRNGRLRRRDRRIELNHDVSDVLAERLRPAWHETVVEPLVDAGGEIAASILGSLTDANGRIRVAIGSIDPDLIEQIERLGDRMLDRFGSLVNDLADRSRVAGDEQLAEVLAENEQRTADHFRFALTEARAASGRGRADRIVDLLLDHAVVTLSSETPRVVNRLGDAGRSLVGALRLEIDDLVDEATADLTHIAELISTEDRPDIDREALDDLLNQRPLLDGPA